MVIFHSYIKLLTRGYHCEIHDHNHHGQESRFISGVSSDSSGPQQSGYATLTWSPNRILRLSDVFLKFVLSVFRILFLLHGVYDLFLCHSIYSKSCFWYVLAPCLTRNFRVAMLSDQQFFTGRNYDRSTFKYLGNSVESDGSILKNIALAFLGMNGKDRWFMA